MHVFRGIQNPWRCHWSDEVQKKGRFFRKIVLPGFWDPRCHPCNLIDFANTALASKGSVETICMNSVGYRTHRAVTRPMSFKKSRRFVGKPCSRVFGAPGCHPSTLFDFINTALAKRGSEKTKCMIAENYRTHSVVTGPMNFKKNMTFFFFFSETHAPWFLGHLAVIQALQLTF